MVISGPRAANTAMNGFHTRASTRPATTGNAIPAHDRGSGSGRGGGPAGTRSVAGRVGGRRRGGRLNGILPAAAPRPALTAAGASSVSVRHCRQVAPSRTVAPAGTGAGSVMARPATTVPLYEPRSVTTGRAPGFCTLTRAWRRETAGSSSTTSQLSERPIVHVSVGGGLWRVPARRPAVTARTRPRLDAPRAGRARCCDNWEGDRPERCCCDWEGDCPARGCDWEGDRPEPGAISSRAPSQIGTDERGVAGLCQHPSTLTPTESSPGPSSRLPSAAMRSATV